METENQLINKSFTKLLFVIAIILTLSVINVDAQALLQQAGKISVKVSPEKTETFTWGLQSDSDKIITLQLSAEGSGSEFLDFPKSIQLAPDEYVHVEIDITIPQDYSGPLTLSPKMVATKSGQSGGPTVINIQMAKTVYITIINLEATPDKSAPEKQDTEIQTEQQEIVTITNEKSGDKSFGGGCLIATAAYGSELAQPIQELRYLRDNTILQTSVGSAFMEQFNSIYYTFSPTISDWERQNHAFREAVKITITPHVYSLSILNYIDADSDFEVLVWGSSILGLNIGIYFVAPAILIWKIRSKFGH